MVGLQWGLEGGESKGWERPGRREKGELDRDVIGCSGLLGFAPAGWVVGFQLGLFPIIDVQGAGCLLNTDSAGPPQFWIYLIVHDDFLPLPTLANSNLYVSFPVFHGYSVVVLVFFSLFGF